MTRNGDRPIPASNAIERVLTQQTVSSQESFAESSPAHLSPLPGSPAASSALLQARERGSAPTQARMIQQMQRQVGNRQVARLINTLPAAQAAAIPPPNAEQHQPLGSGAAQEFGARLGADLSGVQLHAEDGVANEYGAAAVTIGRDIHFARGSDMSNRAVLGHELVHTIQQGAAPSSQAGPVVASSPQQAEAEASHLGPSAAQGKAGKVQQAVPLAHKPAPPNTAVSSPAATPAQVARPSLQPAPPKAPPPAPPKAGPARPEAMAAVAAAAHPPTRATPARPAAAARPQPSRKAKAPPKVVAPSTARAPSTLPAAPAGVTLRGPGAELGRAYVAQATLAAATIRHGASATAEQMRQTAQDHATRLAAEHSAQAAVLDQHAQTGHALLAAGQQSAVTHITSHTQAAQGAVAQSGQEASGHVHQASEQEQQKAAQSGEQAGANFSAAAEGHATRFKQESSARTAQAKPPGGGTGESAEAQAQAADKIAGQAAQNFGKDEGEVENAAQQSTGQVTQHIQQGVSDFTNQAHQGATQVSSGISQLVSTAHSGFGETGAHASGAASTLGAQAAEHIAQSTDTAHDYLTRGVEATAASFHRIAEQHAAQVEQQASIMGQNLMTHAYKQGAAIAREPAEQGRKLMGTARDQLQDVQAKAATGLGGVGSSLKTGFDKHAAAAATEMTKGTAEATTQVAKASQQANQKLSQLQTHVTQQVTLGAATVAQQAHQVGDDTTRQLAQHGTEFAGHVQQGTTQAQQALGKTVDKASADQQANLGTIHGHAAQANSQIASQYDTLKSQADNQSQTDQKQNATQAQPLLDWILPASWTKAIKQWFADVFGKWLGGFLYGILDTLLGVLIIVGIAALLGEVAGAIFLVLVLVLGVVAGIYSRFKTFEAYNGRGPGFWEGLGLVGLGIADITGIPGIIEGLVGYKAFSNGHKMDDFEAGQSVGSGIVQLFAVIFGALKWKGAPEPEVAPKPADPVVDPGKQPDPKADPAKDPDKDPDPVAAGKKMVVERNGNTVTVKDADTGETAGIGDIGADGYVELAIYTKGVNTTLRGGEVFDAIIGKYRTDGIAFNGIRGLWIGGDNLATFNALVSKGLTPERAAGETFTGIMARRAGYSKVRIDYPNSPRNADGTFQKAFIWFDP